MQFLCLFLKYLAMRKMYLGDHEKKKMERTSGS